jgi:hypothetical protein
VEEEEEEEEEEEAAMTGEDGDDEEFVGQEVRHCRHSWSPTDQVQSHCVWHPDTCLPTNEEHIS